MNLMELVGSCKPPQKTIIPYTDTHVNLLLQTGFFKAANLISTQHLVNQLIEDGLIVIRPKNIAEFLIAKAEEYNGKKNGPGGLSAIWETANRCCAITVDIASTDPESVGAFIWQEERINETRHVPPEDVLLTLQGVKASKAFDYFTVAYLEKFPDPLLLGRLDGMKERFFIRQWGDDIVLDDVIEASSRGWIERILGTDRGNSNAE